MTQRLTYQQLLKKIDLKKLKPNFTEDWFVENYKSVESVLPFICSCGNPVEYHVHSLSQQNPNGQQCKECIHKNKWYKKNSYEKVVNILKAEKCKPGFTKKWFNENYVNENTELPIVCKCKKPFQRSIHIFVKNLPGCDECKKNRKKTAKNSYEKVLDGIKKCGLKPNFNKTWYQKNYKGVDTELPLFCKCKKSITRSYTQLGNLKNTCCEECKREEKIKKRYKDLIAYLSKKKIEIRFTYNWFLTNYEPGKMKIPFTCKNCGKEILLKYYTVRHHKFICMGCGHKKENLKRNTFKEEIPQNNELITIGIKADLTLLKEKYAQDNE